MARETTRIGEAQVRAYLAISGVNARYVTVRLDQATEIEWHIEFKVTNSGQTPARNIWFRSDIVTHDAEAVGEVTVAPDISGSADAAWEIRCNIQQHGDDFANGLVDDEAFDMQCKIVVGFTDVFGKKCGPFHFLYGGTKNFAVHRSGGNALIPIHTEDEQ
jgi:hypothetical protein